MQSAGVEPGRRGGEVPLWEGRAKGLLLCFLFQIPQRLEGLGEHMVWGTGCGGRGGMGFGSCPSEGHLEDCLT